MKFLNKKMLVTALCAMMLCGFAGTSEAAFHGPGAQQGNFGGPQPGTPPALTPEQMEQMQQIFNENYASMETTRQNLAAKRAELNAELASPAPDRAKIERLATEIGELRGKMLAARADVRAKLQKQGLPADFYGPRGPMAPYSGPCTGWGGCPGMMMPGMMMMDDGGYGWHGGPRHHGPRHGGHGHGHGGCGW